MHLAILVTGRYQRAHADVEMTARLTLYLERTLIEHFELAAVIFDLPGRIQRTPKAKLAGAWSGMLQGHREGENRAARAAHLRLVLPRHPV